MARLATISSGHLTASISSLGAELQSLADAEGRELQWDGDPSVWRGRAPILFPVIGLLEGGHYRLDGEATRCPNMASRDIPHSISSTQAADAVTFRLAAPRRRARSTLSSFSSTSAFAVTCATLNVEATIANVGAAPMPASFGFHPALRWPLPSGQPRDGHDDPFRA